MNMSRNFQILWQKEAVILHSQRLLQSFQYWTGYPLLKLDASPTLVAQQLFEAPFVIVSHGTQSNPIFNYGNRQALELWQLDWDAFTKLPSRCSAEPRDQAERSQMLTQAENQGLITNYQGIRISSTGKRFKIEDGIIWNVLDEEKQLSGQAATFKCWTPIN